MNIKTTILAIFAVVLFQSAFAQKTQWKELQAFHTTMAATFHPTETGNFQPLRDQAADLLLKAKQLMASPIPANINPATAKKILTSLVAKCDEINNAVLSQQGDRELKMMIDQAHVLFHQLAEECSGGEQPKKK